jgi:hypothetical protein
VISSAPPGFPFRRLPRPDPERSDMERATRLELATLSLEG